MMEPQIHIRKDGPLFRVLVFPPEALGNMLRRPETYASALSARMAAKVLHGMTGFAITDLTDARS